MSVISNCSFHTHGDFACNNIPPPTPSQPRSTAGTAESFHGNWQDPSDVNININMNTQPIWRSTQPPEGLVRIFSLDNSYYEAKGMSVNLDGSISPGQGVSILASKFARWVKSLYIAPNTAVLFRLIGPHGRVFKQLKVIQTSSQWVPFQQDSLPLLEFANNTPGLRFQLLAGHASAGFELIRRDFRVPLQFTRINYANFFLTQQPPVGLSLHDMIGGRALQ
jgi:hypothetical protein